MKHLAHMDFKARKGKFPRSTLWEGSGGGYYCLQEYKTFSNIFEMDYKEWKGMTKRHPKWLIEESVADSSALAIININDTDALRAFLEELARAEK